MKIPRVTQRTEDPPKRALAPGNALARGLAGLLWLVLVGCQNDLLAGEAREDREDHQGHGPHPGDADPHAHPRGETGTQVQLSPAAIQRTGITIEHATRSRLRGEVQVPAEVAPVPDLLVHVAPLVEGQLTEVKAAVGEQVAKGDVLAVLRSVALGETRAALSEAEAELAVAQANFERQEELMREGIGARRTLIEAEGAMRTARARVQGLKNRTRVYGHGGSGATTLLRSPIAGEVVERHATIGEVVRPEQPLFVVTDTRTIWIVGSAYPQDLATIHEGAQAVFQSPDLPAKQWRGQLDWVSPVMDLQTRTLPVRMVLDNPDGRLRPGLFGVIQIAAEDDTSTEPSPVTVRAESLVELQGQPVLFAPGEESGEFRVLPVTPGRRDSERVEIVAGLSANQPYVATGVFILKSTLLRSELGEGHVH